jgi:uncharacterized C2H2 Zn-finger protein
MVQYKCDTCAKVFKQKIDFQRHLNRKKPCQPPIPDPIPNYIQKNVNQKAEISESIPDPIPGDINNYICPNCKTIFKYYSGYNRHINHRCKNKLDNKDEIIKTLITELSTIKQQINTTNTNNSHNTNKYN